ncbi:MAG: PAS domain S-box protein, partial [Chloroflexia bacterium]|nr:PAS domain S-box protein [Chloroflexia bacterium]
MPAGNEFFTAPHLDHGPDCIAVIDANLMWRYANHAWVPVVGFGPEELVGKPAGVIDHPIETGGSATHLQELHARPGATERFRLCVQHRDGTARWLDVAAVNCLSDPEVAGFVITARDVTSQTLAEGQLRRDEGKYRALV